MAALSADVRARHEHFRKLRYGRDYELLPLGGFIAEEIMETLSKYYSPEIIMSVLKYHIYLNQKFDHFLDHLEALKRYTNGVDVYEYKWHETVERASFSSFKSWYMDRNAYYLVKGDTLQTEVLKNFAHNLQKRDVNEDFVDFLSTSAPVENLIFLKASGIESGTTISTEAIAQNMEGKKEYIETIWQYYLECFRDDMSEEEKTIFIAEHDRAKRVWNRMQKRKGRE